MLHRRIWVQVLKREGIECIVAPYEADAQLAYLALTGDVDAVITEDSDLLPYGCPTASFWREASLTQCQAMSTPFGPMSRLICEIVA